MPNSALRTDSEFRGNECLRRVTFFREGKRDKRELVGFSLGLWEPQEAPELINVSIFGVFRNSEVRFKKEPLDWI